ncbi:MAG TPA: hypothetical protein VF898_07860, partial [Chloroflexota bacterium]
MNSSLRSLVVIALVVVFPMIASATTVNFYSGSPTWTAPVGISSPITAYIAGGGGGGGGSDGSGDNHAGGGGGSGGASSNSVQVSGGTTLQFIVGAGGQPASWTFNGNNVCNPSGTTGSKNGQNGGNTSLWGPSGQQIAWVGGGYGGIGNTSDNGDGSSGAGGSPNGASGGAVSPNRNSYPSTPGGNIGWGNNGGYSNGWSGSSPICPVGGGSGYGAITYSCIADVPYTENNPNSIASYCRANGVTCGAGQTYVSSLSCHAGGGPGIW